MLRQARARCELLPRRRRSRRDRATRPRGRERCRSALPPDPDQRGRHDREQARSRQRDAATAERDQGRHEEDPAADAEHAGEHAGGNPEQDGQRDRSSRSSGDQPDPMPVSNGRERERERAPRESLLQRRPAERTDRCRQTDERRVGVANVVPQRVRDDARDGRDRDRAERGRSRLMRRGRPRASRSSGTITIPPADAEEGAEDAGDQTDRDQPAEELPRHARIVVCAGCTDLRSRGS